MDAFVEHIYDSYFSDSKVHLLDEVELRYVVECDGNKYYNRNAQLHREDGPAIEWTNGDKEWWQNDLLHREDGPAIIEVGSGQWWYLNGELHREDGPAVEMDNGTKQWWLNGKYIRGNDGKTK